MGMRNNFELVCSLGIVACSAEGSIMGYAKNLGEPSLIFVNP